MSTKRTKWYIDRLDWHCYKEQDGYLYIDFRRLGPFRLWWSR